jgi:hypothetical protein
MKIPFEIKIAATLALATRIEKLCKFRHDAYFRKELKSAIKAYRFLHEN